MARPGVRGGTVVAQPLYGRTSQACVRVTKKAAFVRPMMNINPDNLVRGILQWREGNYEAAVHLLGTQHRDRVELSTGERAGVACLTVYDAKRALGKTAEASQLLIWVASDACPRDRGNGLQKRWASQVNN